MCEPRDNIYDFQLAFQFASAIFWSHLSFWKQMMFSYKMTKSELELELS